MSEHKTLGPEHARRGEQPERSKGPEADRPSQEAGEAPKTQVEAEAARRDIEQEALSYREYDRQNGDKTTQEEDTITRFDKEHAYKMTLSRLQSRLQGPQKAFSRVIHSKPVEAASSGLEKTIARPSGILGAGLFATLFLAVMLFFARRNGFELSGSELPLALAAGWAAGVGLELITKLLKRRRN